jgi:SAM-dependent methyltransferase
MTKEAENQSTYNPLKRGERLPRRIPQWIKRRVETDIYQLYDFGEAAGQATPPGSWVLDAGAGEGRYKPDFQHARYVGVDLAVGDVTWNYHGLDAICNLTDLPFADGTFDAAVCMQVLEHVPEPLRVLQEIARVLKPGGKLYLSAPQSWPQHQKPYDFFRYTSFGLRHLFNRAGLETESMRNMGGYFWYLSWEFQAINYWLFPKGRRYRPLTLPLRGLFGLIFQLILPLILYYLDRFDTIKDETFGYLCIARKPVAPS